MRNAAISGAAVAVLTATAIGPAGATIRVAAERPLPEPAVPVLPGVVTAVGDIVVMEGDAEIAPETGPGIYTTETNNVVLRFYLHFPDEFDGIAIHSTFADGGSTGGAYAICQDATVTGLAPDTLGPCPGGSTRLISVVNMNTPDQYGDMTVNDDQWFAYMGQEFGHSWLTFFHFINPLNGSQTDEMLGRQLAHYAANVQAFGSVMDGVTYEDNGDGTFTVTEVMNRFSKLDLYAMGIVGPEEVPPFFIIRNAVVLPGGDPLDREWGISQVGVGTRVQGDRLDLTIADLVAANGERRPTWDAAPEEFRQAFVLVTRPGETAAQVMDYVDKLETGRLAWEERFANETQNRGYVCTNLNQPCPIAAAKVMSASAAESAADSDLDGVIEPGETVIATVEYWNSGGADATTAIGEIRSASPGLVLPDPTQLPTIPANERVVVEYALEITGDACGQTLELEAAGTIESRSWKAPFSMRPGILEGSVEPFADDAGWSADYLFTDTAATGRWAYGVAEATWFAGRKLQPDGGRGGATDGAWFTDPGDAWDSGEVAGGETTLWSALYDLSPLYKPTLRYWIWYVALDRTPTSLDPATDSHLVVEASADGGLTWVEVDRVTGGPYRWTAREAPLDGKIEPTAQVRFRFRAFDDANSSQRLVEIGIDDVQIVSLSDACRATGGGGGCGCRVADRRGAGTVLSLSVFAVLALLAIRKLKV